MCDKGFTQIAEEHYTLITHTLLIFLDRPIKNWAVHSAARQPVTVKCKPFSHSPGYCSQCRTGTFTHITAGNWRSELAYKSHIKAILEATVDFMVYIECYVRVLADTWTYTGS